MSSLVSIIMPAFNVADYIAESIESIINQEYKNWELIVINDGSTDSTPDIVRSFIQKDSRIRLYEQENQGVSVARNQGMKIAAGKYLAFLDGDDLWDKSFLMKVVTAKELNPVDMVFSGYQSMAKNGYLKKFRFQYMDGDILLPYLKGVVGMCIGSVLVDKAFLCQYNINFTEGCSMGEDGEFLLKILCIAKVHAVREKLMIYRTRPGSARHSAFQWQIRLQRLEAIKRVVQYMQEYSDKLKAAPALRALTENIGYHRYRLLWRMIKYGQHQDALHMLAEPECIQELLAVHKMDFRITHQLQYGIIMSKNQFLWKACALGLLK